MIQNVTCLYLVECAVQRLVLGHELIQENLEGVHPHCDRRLSPVPLLLPHGLLQDVLKQSVEVFVAGALTVVHLGRKTTGSQEGGSICRSTLDIMFLYKKTYSNCGRLETPKNVALVITVLEDGDHEEYL